MDCREDKEKIRMLFTLLLIAVTATLGEGRGGEGRGPPPSGLAGSGSQEEVSNMLHVLWVIAHLLYYTRIRTVHVYA